MAVVGDVGRAAVRFALADPNGELREDSIRSFKAEDHTTISGALMAFKKELEFSAFPPRCCLAVAGIPRGDTISITGSRWFISRSGLTSMLQYEPVILNDFAANAWAVSAASAKAIQPLGSRSPSMGAGTYLVIGTGTGLGVASFTREADGRVSVVTTEAGHSHLLPDAPEIQPLLPLIKADAGDLCAETLLSASGLIRLRNVIAGVRERSVKEASAEDVVRAASAGDPHARQACSLFALAFWQFAGNLTLIYGAWEGVILTGNMINSLKTILSRPELKQAFSIHGPYARILGTVPVGCLLPKHPELRGAAEAVRKVN